MIAKCANCVKKRWIILLSSVCGAPVGSEWYVILKSTRFEEEMV